MPLLQVKNFPSDIYEEISLEARRQSKTIAQQTVFLIKKGLGKKISNKERRLRLLEEIRKINVPEKAKTIEPAKLIREDRDR